MELTSHKVLPRRDDSEVFRRPDVGNFPVFFLLQRGGLRVSALSRQDEVRQRFRFRRSPIAASTMESPSAAFPAFSLEAPYYLVFPTREATSLRP